MKYISILLMLTAFKSVLSEGSCGIKTSVTCNIRSGNNDLPCEGNIMNDSFTCRKVPVVFEFKVCKVNPSIGKLILNRKKTKIKIRGKVVSGFNKSPLEKSVICRSEIKYKTINTCKKRMGVRFRVKGKFSGKGSCTSYSFLNITPILSCPCFSTRAMDYAVEGILNDSKYLNKEYSCKKSDDNSMSLLYGNPYHWLRPDYSVGTDSCRNLDMVFRTNSGQATECLRLLEDGCESIRDVLESPNDKTCPCFDVPDLVEAVNSIKVLKFSSELDTAGICSKSDNNITMNLPAIKSQEIKQTKSYAAHIEESSETCTTGIKVTEIDSDEASYCFSLMTDACNELEYYF